MNDGPHKSLPLKRHWKTAAKKLADPNCSVEECSEAVDHAIRKEFAEVPFRVLNDIVRKKDGQLFGLDANEKVERLEGSRELCRGNAMAESYIDSLLFGSLKGSPEDGATAQAVADSSECVLRASFLSMIEHYKRERDFEGAERIAAGWDRAVAQCPFDKYVSEIERDSSVRTRRRAVRARANIEQGPPL